MRRALGAVARTAARVLLALLVVVASLALHLGTRNGRRAVRDIAEEILPGVVPGSVSLRAVRALSPSRIELVGVSWRDVANQPVVDDATLSVSPAWRLLPAALGRGPYPRIAVHARRAWARVPALAPPPPPGPVGSARAATPLNLALPQLSLRVDEVVNALGGPRWTAHDLRGDASVIVRDDAPEVTLRVLHAGVTLAQLDPVQLDAAARVRGPRDLGATLQLSGPPARCALRAYSRARAVFVETTDCALSSPLLSTLASTRLPAVRIARATASRGADDALRLDARLDVEGERVDISAALRGDAITATVTPTRARLAWLPGAPPAMQVDGPLRARATRTATGWTFTLDTTAVRAEVSGFSVPGAIAEARLDGTRLDLTSLRVRDLGVDAHGSMDLGVGVSSARAELTARALPLQRVAPPGTPLRGTADLTASLRGEGGALHASLEGSVRDVEAAGVRASSVVLRASGSIAQGRNDLHARAALTGLRAAGVGPIDAVVLADGDPLGALRVQARGSGPLPPAVRRRLPVTPPIERGRFALDATVRRSAAAATVRVARAEVQAGPVTLVASGGADLTQHASGTRLSGLHLALATPGGGAVHARVEGSVADISLRDVSLRGLAPLAPVLATTGGVVRGEVHVDLARPQRSRGEVVVEDLRAPYFGRMSPALVLTPAHEGVNELRLAWNVVGAPRTDAFVSLRMPRRFDDINGWIDGIQRGELSLPPVDVSVFQEELGRGARLRGSVTARVNIARATPTTLAIEASLEGTDLAAGFGALGLRRDLIEPMRVRAALCTEVDPRRGFNDPIRARAAVGVSSENANAPAFFGCASSVRPLPTPLAELSASLEGPWRDAIGTTPTLSPATLAAPPAAWLARLADVPLRVDLDVGPIERSRWPLRAVRLPGMPTWVRQVLAPEVEPDTRVRAALRVEGTAASPRATLTLDASTSKVEPIGLDAPSRATATATLRSTGITFADPLALQFDVRGTIAPDAPPAERGTIEASTRVLGRLSELPAGRAALSLEQLDVRTQNLRAERFGFLSARGARGGVDVRVARTDDPARPFDAVVSLRDLRVSPPGLEQVASTIPPVGATLHAYVAQEGAAARVRACLVAGLRDAPAPCDPRPPLTTAETADGAMRVDAELPFPEGILAAPAMNHLAVAARASQFNIDAVGALVPSNAVDNIGGVLSGEVVWSAERAHRPEGTLTLRDGRATLASLGEPFDDLDVALEVTGNRVSIQRFRGRLGQGRMEVTGDAVLGEDDRIARVVLEANTTELPAVANGNTWAWVTGRFRTEATVRTAGVEVDLRVHEARVRVQDEPARTLIALDADPAVFVLGRTQLSRADVADTLPVDVRFELETPVWLRRSDFAVAVNGRGSIHMDRAGNAVAATIEAARTPSWVSFYGKRFELERAVITLDGNVTLNPQLDLRARHDTGSQGGIVLSLQGRLYEPQVQLISERYPEQGMAETLDLLIRGRRDTSPTTGQTDLAAQAGDMARSIVTGLTLGFVTSTLRAQFAFLPTLIAEPGTSDVGRYGAGFNLGPRVYLQATWGAASTAVGLGTSASGGAAQEFRVLLEYAISTTLNASATYGTLPREGWRYNWGVDVYWSP